MQKQAAKSAGFLSENYLNAAFVGKPDYFQADLDRYRKVTAADVQRVANTYLNDKRLVLTVTPRAKDKMQSVKMNASNKPTSVGEKKEKKGKVYRLTFFIANFK